MQVEVWQRLGQVLQHCEASSHPLPVLGSLLLTELINLICLGCQAKQKNMAAPGITVVVMAKIVSSNGRCLPHTVMYLA